MVIQVKTFPRVLAKLTDATEQARNYGTKIKFVPPVQRFWTGNTPDREICGFLKIIIFPPFLPLLHFCW